MDTGWGLEALKYAIVIVCLIGGVAEIMVAKHYKKEAYAKIKFALGVMLFYWALYYAFSIIRTRLGLSLETHQIFVRGGIFLICSFITAGALMSLRRARRKP